MLTDKQKWFIQICKKIICSYLLLILIWLFLFIWGFWNFFLRKISEKIVPPFDKKSGKRPAPTFLLWLCGIYIALFNIAAFRYESRIDVIENRANAVFAQLSIKEIRTKTLNRIADIQKMQCPYKPSILDHISIF